MSTKDTIRIALLVMISVFIAEVIVLQYVFSNPENSFIRFSIITIFILFAFLIFKYIKHVEEKRSE